MPVPAIVANMGTSLRMIDEHYGHVLADMQSVALTQPRARDVLDRDGMVARSAVARAAAAATAAAAARVPAVALTVADDQPWIADDAAPWNEFDDDAETMG